MMQVRKEVRGMKQKMGLIIRAQLQADLDKQAQAMEAVRSLNEDEFYEEKARGQVKCVTARFKNFILIFGAPPNIGVRSDTRMIYELAEAMLSKYDQVTFMLIIPAVFNDMYSEDASIEMIASSTLKPLVLFYEPHTADESIAFIFANGKLDYYGDPVF